MSKPKAPQVRIVRAPGANIITEDQAPLVYSELLKIAEKLKVDNVRALDSKIVCEIVEADPNHPLRVERQDRCSQASHRPHDETNASNSL
jgi:hypothetical protein